jgi:hypothetical protein
LKAGRLVIGAYRPNSFQNPFHYSVPLIKVVAPDQAFVQDENIFSGLGRFSCEGHSEYLPALNDIEGSVGN